MTMVEHSADYIAGYKAGQRSEQKKQRLRRKDTYTNYLHKEDEYEFDYTPLRTLMAERGLKQKDLPLNTQVSTGIFKYALGITSRQMEKLCTFFEVSEDSIVRVSKK